MGCRLDAAEVVPALLQAFCLNPDNLGCLSPPKPQRWALTTTVENANFISVTEVHVEEKAVASEDGAGTSGPQHHLRHVLQVWGGKGL